MAKTKVAAAVQLLHRELLESELSPTQCDVVEDMAAFLMDETLARDAFTTRMNEYVTELWAKFPPWAAYKAVRKVIHDDLGEYPTECFRAAVKRVFGKLPTAGKGSGKGKQGVSPVKYVNGMITDVRHLIDRLKVAPKRDLTPARMASIGKLVAALALEVRALKRDVA